MDEMRSLGSLTAQSSIVHDPARRLLKIGSVLLAVGVALSLYTGLRAEAAEAVTGYAMDGCGSDPDDQSHNAQPCFSQYLSGVWVGLRVGGHTEESTVTDSEGRFRFGGSGEILGGGYCGEQPKGEPEHSLLGSEVVLFYPNDADDSPHGTCPATMGSSSPIIESESASNVSTTDATLEAVVNPQSAERGVHYQFQVVSDPSEYRSGFTCPSEGFPANSSLCLGLEQQPGALPISSTSAGVQGQDVSVNLAGPWGWWSGGMTLKPGTTYHYRVIVARSVQTVDTIDWEPPIVYGPDRTFTTPPSGRPLVESESVSNPTPTDATLEADVNLHEGAPAGAYYQFQVVKQPSEYASEILCPEPLHAAFDSCVGFQSSDALPIGLFPDNAAQLGSIFHAALDLAAAGVALQSETTYHYRVLVAPRVPTEDTIEWEAPATIGPDETFTTPEEAGGPPSGGSGSGGSGSESDSSSHASSSSGPQPTCESATAPRPLRVAVRVHHRQGHLHRVRHRKHRRRHRSSEPRRGHGLCGKR